MSAALLSLDRLVAETSQTTEAVADSFSVRIVHCSEPPKIDGKLDEDAWGKAATFSNFTQVRPREGVAPSEKTEIRLLCDSDFLYIGIRAYDSEPDKVIAKQMQRDINLRSEDRVRFTIDTFRNLRGGYYFAINARGSRQDGLVDPGGSGGGYQSEWDGIWYGESSIDDLGWVAEVAIPAKTISFDPRDDTWGFNVERDIERKGERIRWSGAQRNKRITDMSSAGTITDIRDFTQGRGIDFVPYLKADFKKDYAAGTDSFELKPGMDFFYKLSPSVTMALTVNTDFAESEVDARRVNLTRFPLFFEEKRDFFLQDANIFSFGQIGRSPLPFHSRRIGLTPGREPLDILAGGKITGRIGDLNFGFLNVQVDEFENLDSKNLTVGRVSMNVLGESETGIIVTHGNPSGDTENSIFGYDFNFKNSDFGGSGQIIESHLYVMKSFTPGLSGNDFAYGASVGYPNDKWEFSANAEQIDRNFDPALGFVDKPGTRKFQTLLVRSWHPDRLESLSLDTHAEVRTRLDGEIIDGELQVAGLSVENLMQDEFLIAPLFLEEQLFEPFEILDGIVIPIGNYSFSRYLGEFVTSDARSLSASISVEGGDFFTGARTDLSGTVGWRPSPHFNVSANYETNIIELPEGDFTVNVAQLNLNVIFSPRLAWNIVNQWDDESNRYGINGRIRWTIKPGNDLFLVFNQEIDTSTNKWKTVNSDLSTKAAWTFRF